MIVLILEVIVFSSLSLSGKVVLEDADSQQLSTQYTLEVQECHIYVFFESNVLKTLPHFYLNEM